VSGVTGQPVLAPPNRTRCRQIHVWLSETEYQRLQVLARQREESLSTVVRRLIKAFAARVPEPPAAADVRGPWPISDNGGAPRVRS
jgi:hypothetical protein